MTSNDQIKRKNRTVHSISFKENDFKIIKLAAEQQEVSFASFVKNAALAFARESFEHRHLVESGELNEKDKPIVEVIGDFKDTIGQTMVTINENNGRKLKRIEWMLEQIIYILLYFNFPIEGSDEQLDALVKFTKQRVKNVMNQYKED